MESKEEQLIWVFAIYVEKDGGRRRKGAESNQFGEEGGFCLICSYSSQPTAKKAIESQVCTYADRERERERKTRNGKSKGIAQVIATTAINKHVV